MLWFFLKAKGFGPKQCTLQSEGFLKKNQKKIFSGGKQQNPGFWKERTPRQKTKSAWSDVAQYWRSQNRHCISSQSLSTWEQTHIVPPDTHCVPPYVPDRRPMGHFGRRLPTRGVGGRPRPPGFQYPSEKVWQEFLVCCHPQEAPQPALFSPSPSPLLSPGRGSTNANMSCIAQASGLTFGVYALANCQYQTCLSPSHAPSRSDPGPTKTGEGWGATETQVPQVCQGPVPACHSSPPPACPPLLQEPGPEGPYHSNGIWPHLRSPGPPKGP